MNVTVTTSSSSAYFQPPPLIDLPEDIPEGADYTTFVKRLVDSYGDRSYRDWYFKKSFDYARRLKKIIDNFNQGEPISTKEEVNVVSRYLDYLDKCELPESSRHYMRDEWLYGYQRPSVANDFRKRHKGVWGEYMEDLMRFKKPLSKKDFEEIFLLYKKPLDQGMRFDFPSATLSASTPKTAQEQNRQLEQVALYV